VFRTVGEQSSLWELILPAELLVLPAELARVDALLDDAVFFAPFAPYFDARIGRPSIPDGDRSPVDVSVQGTRERRQVSRENRADDGDRAAGRCIGT